MKRNLLTTLCLAALLAWLAQPGFSVSKETIQMMTQLDTLQQEVQTLQRTVDTQSAILKTLIQQTGANVDSMKDVVGKMQAAEQRSLADTGNRFDTMTGEIQQLSASLDETKGELSKLSDQLAQTQKIIQTINAPAPNTSAPGAAPANGNATGTPPAPGVPQGTPDSPAGAGGAGNVTSAPPVPDPQTLYNSAYADYSQGQYQLAIQGFQQYLQTYGDTDLASNAQFYVGDSYYNQKDYKEAVKQYDQCIQSYPSGNKAAAAYLKKGYALLALNERTAGERELHTLLRKYPGSREASLARERLQRLRVASR
ncbi:MAG: tol-pal system protein YbgF [Terriglobia bacterium]